MAGTKRSADDSGPSTRSSKAAKTDSASTPSKGKKGGAKKGAKAAIPTSQFKSKALPLHVHITHTPPTVSDSETVPATSADPGSLGSLTLLPSSFATGSYGWKGSKRITVELQNPEGGEEKEKVQVMLTINATVMGSKQAAGEEEANGEEHKDEAAGDAKGEEADGEEAST